MDSNNNVTPFIQSKIGKNLHLQKGNPIGQMKKMIEEYFTQNHGFSVYDNLPPTVTTIQNFDDLLTPLDHVSRSPSDTYYISKTHLLRSHMTAHQTELIRSGATSFLMAGDVYRRDEVDATHYPVFHQIDGVKLWDSSVDSSVIMEDLKKSLGGMIQTIFGNVEMRWIDAYFPFTEPSLELEILFEGRWLEVLGCGQIQPAILSCCAKEGTTGWAFGIGLERLAMVLYDIPDIRLFWSDDERFLSQFSSGKPVKFKPFSKYPPCYKDITFWLPESGFHENDLNSIIREIAGDLVESVQKIDSFTHPKSGHISNCFRINYRHMSRSLTNTEVDSLQEQVRSELISKLGIVLR